MRRLNPRRVLIEVLQDPDALPVQGWDSNFGEPSITVIDNGEFRIDVLYWPRNTSWIHSHVSCGSFMALSGKRVHSTYAFTPEQQFDQDLSFGELRPTVTEVMRSGDVRAISPDLTHELFWIEKPSVTVSIRCTNHPAESRGLPLDYSLPGFAVVPPEFQPNATTSRWLSGLRLMRLADKREYAARLRGALETASPSRAFLAFREAAVEELSWLRDVLDSAASRPDGATDRFGQMAPEIHRRRVFSSAYLSDDGEQMLAALLWTGRTGAELRALMAEAFPGEDPVTVFDQRAATILARSAEAGPYIDEARRSLA